MAARPTRYGLQIVVGAAAATLVAGFLVGRVTAPQGDPRPAKVSPAKGAVGTAAKRGAYVEKKEDLDPSPTKGPADAPIVIYEVSDFQCPFCSRVGPTIDQVVQAYPDDVQIVWKNRPLDFHKDARLAGIAAAAAARQGHFWKYHDTIFANQKALKREDLIKYAEDLGLDMAQFKKDLDDKSLGRKVDADNAASVAVGATGTPAFYINGVKLSGAKPFEEFKAEIDKQLAKAAELEKKGVARERIARMLTAQAGGQATKFIKYMIDEQPAPKVSAKPTPAAKKEDTTTVWKVTVDNAKDAQKGPPTALVTIAEFSEFQCPFCSKVNPTIKQITDTYGDKVRIVFKHNPLSFHADAPLAAEASLAAKAQGKFWEMHDLLFTDTKKLKRPDLEAYAEQLGLDMAKFKAALDARTYQAQVEADQALAEKVQAKGTPNNFVNGRKLTGAKPFEEFKTIIDEEIKKAEKLLADGVKPEALYDTLIAKGKTFNPLDARVQTISVDGAPTIGKNTASITIVEYSDFECPYCSRVGKPVKTVQAKYPDDVRVVFKHFPLNFHKNAQKAAEASMAAHAQGRFWDLHDLMFQNQKALGVPQLKSYAQQIGLDVARFNQELDSGKYAAVVKADMAEGNRVGVRGTPSVYINGRKYSPGGGYSAQAIEKLLVNELGLKKKP